MTNQTLTAILKSQYANTWQMLADAISAFTPQTWLDGSSDFMTPCRLAYHTIQAVEFHLNHDPENFDWNANRINWEKSPPENLPNQQEMLEYLMQTRKLVEGWIDELGDKGLMGPEPRLDKWFNNALSHALYVLRHTQYHTGHLDAELHRHGHSSPDWQ